MKKIIMILALVTVSLSLLGAAVDRNSHRYHFYSYKHWESKETGQRHYSVSVTINLMDKSSLVLDYRAYENLSTPAVRAIFSNYFGNSVNRKYLDSTLTFKSSKAELKLTDNSPIIVRDPFVEGSLYFVFDLSQMPGEVVRNLMISTDIEVYIDMERLDITPSERRMIADFFRDCIYGKLQYDDVAYFEFVRAIPVSR